jgi:hypothetical protein
MKWEDKVHLKMDPREFGDDIQRWLRILLRGGL